MTHSPTRLGRLAAIALGLCLAWPVAAAMTEEKMIFKGAAEVDEGAVFPDPYARGAGASSPEPHRPHRGESGRGWVRLEQCHSHIDAVPSSQITYGAGRIRDLRFTRAEQIGKAWVEGHTV